MQTTTRTPNSQKTSRPRQRESNSALSVLVAADWAPIRLFDEVVRSNPEAVYGDLLPVLRTADLRIVNCECALTRARHAVWKSGSVFKGEPRHAKGLSAVPFDVACLANNHVLDYGVAGLRETLATLRGNGVLTVGAGLTGDEAWQPLSVTVSGTPVHVVNFGEGEDLTASRGGPGVFGWHLDRVTDAVARCRKQGGIVIAVGHCGLEYVPYPPPYVTAAFRAIAEAGAHCVIGHHPHVPQGIEWHEGAFIAYSLGNFVFYQPTALCYRKLGFLVRLQFHDDRLSDVHLRPYRITDAGLRQLEAADAASFRSTLARLSRPLKTPAGVERCWQAYLAYYGVRGFVAEVEGVLEKMRTDPPKGAAMFRNRITTIQHVALWRDFLTRMIDGERTRHSTAAFRMVQEYFCKTLAEVGGPRV